MKISDSLKINSKKVFRDKKNIYFMSVLIFFSILLLLILNFKENFFYYIKNTITENIGFRTISLFPKDSIYIEKLNDLEHIDYIYSSKYGYTHLVSSYEGDSYDGWLQLLIGNEYTLPLNIKGQTINSNDTGLAICPNEFLPSSKSEDVIVNNSLMMKGNDILNSTFDVFYESYRLENGETVEDELHKKTFKIVGLYDSKEVANYNNACYVSERDIKEINDITATLNLGFTGSYAYYAVVDKLDNVKMVIEKLNELGFFGVSVNNYIDIDMVESIENLCDILLIATIIILVIITIFYTKKKDVNDRTNIGLLRSIGYNKLSIIKHYFLEIAMISIISLVIGVLVFGILYFGASFLIIKPFVNMIFEIKLFLITFLITLGVIIVPIIFKMLYLLVNINRNIVNLSEEKNYDI